MYKTISKQSEIEKNLDKTQTIKEYKEQYGDQCELLAVYGTLRKDQGNSPILFGSIGENGFSSILLGSITTEKKYKMYHLGGFPGVVHDEENPTSIVCDIYLVGNKNILDRVDMLEGYRGEEYNDREHPLSNFYNKEKIQTIWGEASIYIYNGSPRINKTVESGDWVKDK